VAILTLKYYRNPLSTLGILGYRNVFYLQEIVYNRLSSMNPLRNPLKEYILKGSVYYDLGLKISQFKI
jgi:hypothetical protein